MTEPVTPEDIVSPPAEGVEAPPKVVHSDYVSNRAFVDMPISPEILQGLAEIGYKMATPIQAASIEPALAGKDLVLRAKTGTGKTAAFGIPVIERIAAGDRKTRAIALAPTRELALQIAQELAGIARYKDIRIAAIYGGVGFGPQEQALKEGSEIVVGTPGRLLDHIKRGNLKLGDVQVAVLDEADEMLSMGFLEDVRKILDRTPESRQTLLCSATIDESMKSLVKRYLRDPEEILLSSDGDNVEMVTHVLYETSPDYHKARALADLIEQERPTSAIIFCNTREDVATVYTYLDRQGFKVEMLTGEMPQNKRERVMARIKAAAVQYLVATDVAARGIDISDLSHVVNYALPDDAAVYLHRAGRTGRIGKTGVAITLAGGSDFSTRLSLERIHRIKFQVKALPTPEQLVQLRADRIGRLLKDASGSSAFESYVDVVRLMKERPDADVIFATALRSFFQWERQKRVDVETENGEERPSERREDRRDDRGRGDGRRDDRGRREDRPDRRDERREERPTERREERPVERRDENSAEKGEKQRTEKRMDRPRREGADTRLPKDEGSPRPERPPREDRPRRRKEVSETETPTETPPDAAAAADGGTPMPADDLEADEVTEGGEETAESADGVKKKRRRRRRSGPKPAAPAPSED